MSVVALLALAISVVALAATDQTAPHGVFRGVLPIAKFDVSPPLRDITPVPFNNMLLKSNIRNDDRDNDLAQSWGIPDWDTTVQSVIYPPRIPAPIVSFDGQPNTLGVAPPDPVGDVGPNHYVAMVNTTYQIFNKTGTSLLGPSNINTLFSGFGGPCQTENSGDPVVLYDQFDDRWILSQFTSAGPTYYNCVAISQTPDPTGAYYRYAITTGTNFPDYPKYGIWRDAIYISTREFAGSPFAGVGGYALNRVQFIAGNPAAQVVSMLVPPSGGGANVGDGLLPADVDGPDLPPVGAPEYFMGSMDNGGPYGATQDALTLWKFTADFTTPANTTFVLANTIPISAYTTTFSPCGGGRACIPQAGTTNKIDILSYRQRPLNRLAYRNFGDHEALVTNQSVDANGGIAGIRWWEVRSPNVSPVLFQDATYAPGLSDTLHRWMGSVAMDGSGNMALGYSVSNASTFPSIAYTGRLASDPVNTMPQGEQYIVNGTGSQTGGGNRWGDYTSMNIDPVDDCTFWYINEYVPSTSASGWRARIGSFRFNECGTPGFSLGVSPASQSVCVGNPATYTASVGSVAMFAGDVALSLTGNPAPSTGVFAPNPVTPAQPANTSTLTVSPTTGVAAGTYPLMITGMASGAATKMANVDLVVYATAPGPTTLLMPANGATNLPARPSFSWSGINAQNYTLEIATDAGFSSIVFTTTVAATSQASQLMMGQCPRIKYQASTIA
ncbi:MAG: hypothetical protein ABI451_06995 [Dokdonella sp.]